MTQANDRSSTDNWFYDQQFRRYIVQFMSIFSGMKVKVGKKGDKSERLIPVPIRYGSRDRVVEAIINENTQNKLLRLPVMSAYLNSVEMAPELRKAPNQIRRDAHLPRGGLAPDDIRIAYQVNPTTLRARAELAIYASNTDQHFQMLEQIFFIFNPSVEIQTSDGPFDAGKLTTVEMTGINFEQNYPQGIEQRAIISTIEFEFPVYLSGPVNIRDNFVKEARIRVGIVDSCLDDVNTAFEKFQQDGFTEELIFDSSDFTPE